MLTKNHVTQCRYLERGYLMQESAQVSLVDIIINVY